MREALPFAKQMLAQNGEFYPYGVTLGLDGNVTHVSAQGKTDHPASKELIDVLVANFQEEAAGKRIKASAIVFDVLIKLPEKDRKVDAIQVNLDHSEDYSVEVLFPYSMEQGRLSYDSPFAQMGSNLIFR